MDNQNVYNACIRLLYELDLLSNISNPYALPYANYVMSWPQYIPINTIIIGQNPYPQHIYPEYGAAFAYDPQKVPFPPKTVQVLAHDVHNYDDTDFSIAIECFRDSWRLLDAGIVFINETVFDKLKGYKSNTRAIKEMESQLRALQTLIAESYFVGQETITCIGMGIPAAEMTSILRSWYPKDLFRIKVITCRNPAARDIGDLPSHEITIGKTAVSKILSAIVKRYSNMPPLKISQIDKRKQQNVKMFKDSTNVVSTTADIYANELQSFEDRFRAAQESTDENISAQDIIRSSGNLKKATEKHTNAIAAHSMALLMLIESLPKPQDGNGSIKSGQDIPIVASSSMTPQRPRRGPRRVSALGNSTESISAVPETPEPEDIVSTTRPTTASVTTSRARRRAVKEPSYAESNTPTEYTTDTPLNSTLHEDVSAAESVSMKCFGNWCADNIKDDPTYSEILNSAAEERMTPNELSKSVLEYIRLRKAEDFEYDAYDELTDPDSKSSAWANQNIVVQK